MTDPELAWTVASYLAIRHGRPSMVTGNTIEVQDHEGMRFLLSRRGGGVSVLSPRTDVDGEVRSFVAGRVRAERDVSGLANDIWHQVGSAPQIGSRLPASSLPATSRILSALREAAPEISFTTRRGRVGVGALDVDVIETDEPNLPAVAVGEHGAWIVTDDEGGVARDIDMVSTIVDDFIEARDARRQAFAM